MNKNKELKTKEAFRNTIKALKGIYPEGESLSIARLLFEDFQIDAGPLGNPETELPEKTQIKIRKAVKRLLNNEPIQYILGYSWFYDRKFIVGRDNLIPRQETELLVDRILKNEKNKPDLKILDIGTGSGCIAVSLGLELPESKVWASDISEKALETARLNIQENKADIQLIHDDILHPNPVKYPEFLDVIVSNPPYVRNLEKKQMNKNVLDWEPDLALFVKDKDPLIFYKKIAEFAGRKLLRKGRLYFEINEAFGKETAELLDESGFKNIEIHKDFNEKDRIISASYE